ncbi:MAG: DUF4173 domain-containing protein [Coriobacteriia bacterium]|nr:DUF4173 domain-containing protein [Coriobacteriia bacterium]
MDATQGQGEALPQDGNQVLPHNKNQCLPPNSYAAPVGEPVLPAADTAPSPQRKTWQRRDFILALALLALGFCQWEWNLHLLGTSGAGDTVFFLACIIIALIYLQSRDIQQDIKSSLALGVAVAGALPFILYGSRDFNILLWFFEIFACLVWIAYSCRSIIAPRLSLFLAADLFNQSIIVPWGNCGGFFGSLFKWHTSVKSSALKTAAIIVAGIAVSLPLLLLVGSLLETSDDGFAQLLVSIRESLSAVDMKTLRGWGLNLLLGIPFAAFFFGSIVGNASHRHVAHLKYDSMMRTFTKAHRLSLLAFYAPLGILVAMYLIYFIAMGTYLTSALAGELPNSFTYAQYARQGFFELCTVAAINLMVMGVVYLLAKRQPRTSPLPLRVLTAALSLLTIALVITAASKMLLYINTYGLSPLRLYTSVFMLLLLIVFALLFAWHLKPFNAARPCIAAAVALFLALSLANTDGLIARYNVDQYLKGSTEHIDTKMLRNLSPATLPALSDLALLADDAEVKKDAWEAIDRLARYDRSSLTPEGQREWDYWYHWNLVGYLGWQALDGRELPPNAPAELGAKEEWFDAHRSGERYSRVYAPESSRGSGRL